MPETNGKGGSDAGASGAGESRRIELRRGESAKGGSGPSDLIALQDVVKTYESEAGTFDALRGINLSVGRSEFVSIVGKSGSGKSTLINMIAGIDRPTSGSVLIDGTAVHKLSENKLAIWRGKTLGIVFQFFQLLPTLTVLENVMLPMDFCGTFSAFERPKRAMELLTLVGLEDQSHKLPSAISGGQQQRAAIARALANDPPILLADEPTGNLDSVTGDAVIDLFHTLVDAGKTILIVTHDADLAASGTRTIVLADGSIVEQRHNERRRRAVGAGKLAAPLALVFALGLALAACGGGDEGEDDGTGPTSLPPIESSSDVVADAIVVPAEHASLGFEAGGTIDRVLVAEGETVGKGDILVRLDGAVEAAAVMQAQADVAAAEAQFRQISAGASGEEVRAAEAVVASARAAARSASGQVASAAAARDKVVGGATNSDVAVAMRRIDSAKNTLWGAQAQRDAVCGRVETKFAQQADCDQAEAEVGRMHEEVRIAELELNRLLIGARSEDVRVVSAGVSSAQGQLESANAEIARAQALLDSVKVGATGVEIEIASARVDQANAALEAARARMDRTVLRAPFSGTIAALEARPGEQVGPGIPVVRLADTSRWLIETDSLTELSVVEVVEGARADITIDALPDLQLTGQVDRIRSFGENNLGDITYRVIIVPDEVDPRLRWNMTASVTIEGSVGASDG